MKPITQEILGPPNGDCFAACVATILEVELDQLPNYHGYNWFTRWEEFLYRNYRCVPIYWEESPDINQLAWWIAEVKTPPRGIMHSVVFYKNEFKWDPHPGANIKWTVEDSQSFIAIYSISSIEEG